MLAAFLLLVLVDPGAPDAELPSHERVVLTQRYGAPTIEEPDQNDLVGDCAAWPPRTDAGQPWAWAPTSPLTAFQWQLDSHRRLVLYERDRRAEALYFSARGDWERERPTEPGWKRDEIAAVLASIDWDRMLGAKLGCPVMALIHTNRVHNDHYYERGFASVTYAFSTRRRSSWCDSPAYRDFTVGPLLFRTGRIDRVIPAVPTTGVGTVGPIEEMVSGGNPEEGPSIEVDDLTFFVEDTAGLRKGEETRYAVLPCGRVVGSWPPTQQVARAQGSPP